MQRRIRLWAWWCWFMATRPVISGMASCLVLLSFSLAEQNLHNAWLPALEAFLISAATMVLNNYVDRKHDVKESRRHAFDNPRASLIYAYIIWATAIGTVLGASYYHQSIAHLAVGLGLCTIGIAYSHLRRLTAASALATAVASSGVIGFALPNNPTHPALSRLALFVLNTLFARENIKDLSQSKMDIGWKRTIAAVYGWEIAINVSQICLVSGYFLLRGMHEHFSPEAWILSVMGLSSVVNAVRFNYRLAYYLLDIAVLMPLTLQLLERNHQETHYQAIPMLPLGIKPKEPEGAPISEQPIASWVRPALVAAFVLIVFALRLLNVHGDGQSSSAAVVEGFKMATCASFWLLLLSGLGARILHPIEPHEESCKAFYLLIKRMLIGMGIGVAAITVLDVAGIPIWVTGSLLAAWATFCRPKLCRILRDRATQFGIYVAVGIACGAECSLTIMLGTLAIAGVTYYGHQALRPSAATA